MIHVQQPSNGFVVVEAGVMQRQQRASQCPERLIARHEFSGNAQYTVYAYRSKVPLVDHSPKTAWGDIPAFNKLWNGQIYGV